MNAARVAAGGRRVRALERGCPRGGTEGPSGRLPRTGGPPFPIDGRARGGFTLIELMVTLLILAVVAGAAAPALLAPRSPPELDDAQGRLEALLRMARDSAVRSATPVTVVVDSASGLVWFDARARLDGEFAPLDEAPPRGVAPDGTVRLRTEGAFGGGSTLGRALADPGGGPRAPAHGESLDLPRTVRLELFGARALFTFAAGGSAMGDSLLLRSSSGETRLITVDPWSGRARVR